MSEEGYVLHTYGGESYLRQAVASVSTLRRYDVRRPVVLYCTDAHQNILEAKGLAHVFTRLESLPEGNRSITGFKHHLHRFMPFDRTLYVDSDMVWCRNPDPLWTQFSVYPFTATGLDRADLYFGGPKSFGVFLEYLRDRRQRTLRRFNLTYLPRVQAGMIYVSDRDAARTICETAAELYVRRGETHFRTRFAEGRSEESCEWSLAMAMSRHAVPVYNWYQGYNSPQLDFIPGMTSYTGDFEQVTCRYYSDRFIFEIRGLKNAQVRNFLIRLAGFVLRRQDYFMVTPFVLHFSWLHAKGAFLSFADREWARLTAR